MSGQVKKEIKKLDKHLYQITITYQGKNFDIELDKTPYRHKGEDYETYRERKRMVQHFEKLANKQYVFKSKTHLENILGQKGKTYIKPTEDE